MSRISKDRVFTTLNEDVALTIAFYHLCRYEDQVERERVTLLECERTTLATFADWFLNEGGAPLKTNFDLFLILCDKYGFFPMVRSKRGVRKMTSLPFSYGDILGSYYKRKPTQTVDEYKAAMRRHRMTVLGEIIDHHGVTLNELSSEIGVSIKPLSDVLVEPATTSSREASLVERIARLEAQMTKIEGMYTAEQVQDIVDNALNDDADTRSREMFDLYASKFAAYPWQQAA